VCKFMRFFETHFSPKFVSMSSSSQFSFLCCFVVFSPLSVFILEVFCYSVS